MQFVYLLVFILVSSVKLSSTRFDNSSFLPINDAPAIPELRKTLSSFQRFLPMGKHVAWDYRMCQKLVTLMQKKNLAIQKIMQRINELEPTAVQDLHDQPIQRLQADGFRILAQELNETESVIWTSMQWLDDVLSGDYTTLLMIAGHSLKRLNSLRRATLKEEEEYLALLKAEENMQKLNHTHVKGVIDDFLHEVSNVADDLESKINEHIFKDAVHDIKSVNGLDIETVIRVPYNVHKLKKNETIESRILKAENVRLIDANENHFVLSRSKDSSLPHDDRHLVQDLILLWMMATAGGCLCSILHLPPMFGYVFSGIILGPAMLNVIQCIVQVETFGEFGIFFILFSGGLEFMPNAIKRVFKVASLSMVFVTSMLALFSVVLGMPWNVSISECVFVASCLSLSSSSLVLRFLRSNALVESSGNHKTNDMHLDCKHVLLSIIIIQKVYMGLLMAVLPNMAIVRSTDYDASSFADIFLNLFIIVFVLYLMSKICSWSRKQHLSKLLQDQRHHELTALIILSFLFLFLMVTEHLRMSMELGCFLAGIVISMHSHTLAEDVANHIQPIRDLLACLFFASIGLHIYPQFVAQELTVVVALTVSTLFAKYVLYLCAITFLDHHSSTQTRWMVPAGLAQVSECSFVLASRARKLGLISREVYLLILGVTILSLLIAPVLWNVSLSYTKKKLLTNSAHDL